MVLLEEYKKLLEPCGMDVELIRAAAVRTTRS
jgi:hypothetical protein